MLIHSQRFKPGDAESWQRHEQEDTARAALLRPRIDRASVEIARFLEADSAYVSVSWGKDSVTVADLVLREAYDLPIVWVRIDGAENPECLPVRDAFLALHPRARYHEIHASKGVTLTSENGFLIAAERFGPRRITGLRKDESADREMRFAAYGHATETSCAPLSLWSSADVFAYLRLFRLPVCSVYAMTLGGAITRDDVRVSALGGRRGTGRGRREWEQAYYPEIAR